MSAPATDAATDLFLTDLRCHCGEDAQGHRPGSAECLEAPVKQVPVRPFSEGPRPGQAGATAVGQYGRLRKVRASGACPTCGRSDVVVTAVMRLGAPWFGKGPDPQVKHRVPLGFDVRLAAHKGPGKGAKACTFSGPPAEMRFTPAGEHDLAAWEREHGPGSIQ